MMAKRSKKLGTKCFRPSDWLSSTELRRLPFYPQIGDEIIYFRQGHELYVNIVKQKKIYEVNPSSLPWSKQTIDQQELVRILCVTYEVEPPRLVCLKLGSLEPKNGTLTRKTFVIKYHDIEEVPDFLVLKQDYDAAITRQWNSSQRFRSLLNDHSGVQMWWEGQFMKREPFNPEFPESMFLCYLVRWDNGDFDRLSPWDLENIDPKRKPCRVGAGVRVLPIEILRTSYMPGINDWPPVGDRDSESDRISFGISQIMDLDVAKHFSSPVDLDDFPTYASIVKYPMDLSTIKARLDHRFYRRVAAVEHDIRRIHINALLFNDPKKSDIVKNSCITTDLCLEIIRDADVDVTALYRQYLEGGNKKETRGKSSETSNRNGESSQLPPGDSSLNGLDKEQNQISLKLSSFINADGPNTVVSLTMDGHKLDECSELESVRDEEITSQTKEKIIYPEEVKIEYLPKPKKVASISPYTFPRSDESKAVNLEENDVPARVDRYSLPMSRMVSRRRSAFPFHKVMRDHFEATLLPEPTVSSFSTVSTSESPRSKMFDRPKARSNPYIIDETCHQNSEITFTTSVKEKSLDSNDVIIEFLAKRRKTSMSETDVISDEDIARNQEDNCMSAYRVQNKLTTTKSVSRKSRSLTRKVKRDNLAYPSLELTHLPLTMVSSTSHAGTKVLSSHNHRSSFHQRFWNNRSNLTSIRSKVHDSSVTFENASITSVPVPIAVSTPIGRRKNNEDSNTSIELRKPRLLRNGTNNEISEQSPCCTHSSGNLCDIKKKNKRRLPSSSGWNISYFEHVAQETSATKSPKMQEQPSQPSLLNELPAKEMVAKNLHPQLNSSSRKAEEALETVNDIPANIHRSIEVQIASLTSEKSFSAMTDAPPLAELERADSHGTSSQPISCSTSIFKENRNEAADLSASKGNLLCEVHDKLQKLEVTPTSSNFFCPPFCEQFKAPDSLLKKTLKKEHHAKRLTHETKCGSKKDHLCEMTTDNRSETTGSNGRPSRSRSKDSLIAKILAESKAGTPIEKVTSGKSEIKPRKEKNPFISGSSKIKKPHEEPINVAVSIEEIMKKYLGSEICDEQPEESKKGRKKRPLDPKKKRSDQIISKRATTFKDNVENVGDASSNVATSGKTHKIARKRTSVKNASTNEQLNFVERILRERK
uniref:Wd repeat domain-containing-like protein n=1 Tax=Daphnia magna TaxID=35525 RepID=A0A0P6ELS4_9CRUS